VNSGKGLLSCLQVSTNDGPGVCELVLFMLMPRPGCEDNHAGTLAVVTILRQ